MPQTKKAGGGAWCDPHDIHCWALSNRSLFLSARQAFLTETHAYTLWACGLGGVFSPLCCSHEQWGTSLSLPRLSLTAFKFIPCQRSQLLLGAGKKKAEHHSQNWKVWNGFRRLIWNDIVALNNSRWPFSFIWQFCMLQAWKVFHGK